LISLYPRFEGRKGEKEREKERERERERERKGVSIVFVLFQKFNRIDATLFEAEYSRII